MVDLLLIKEMTMGIFILIILGILIDYFSKLWALNTLSKGLVIDIIPNYLDFEYLENRGAAFGIFQGKMLALSLVTILIVLALIITLIRAKNSSVLYRISLALIISGALGNLYDRLIRGFVVDFIHFHLNNTWHFPTFNFADMLVTFGAFFMIIYLIRSDETVKV